MIDNLKINYVMPFQHVNRSYALTNEQFKNLIDKSEILSNSWGVLNSCSDNFKLGFMITGIVIIIIGSLILLYKNKTVQKRIVELNQEKEENDEAITVKLTKMCSSVATN